MKSCVKTSVLQVTQTICFFYACRLLLHGGAVKCGFLAHSLLLQFPSTAVHSCTFMFQYLYHTQWQTSFFSWEHCNCSKGCTDLIETTDMNVMEQLDRNEWNTNIVHTHWFIIYCITYHFDLTKRLSKYAKIFSWNKNKILYIGSIN